MNALFNAAGVGDAILAADVCMKNWPFPEDQLQINKDYILAKINNKTLSKLSQFVDCVACSR
jgi:hypothetical protein